MPNIIGLIITTFGALLNLCCQILWYLILIRVILSFLTIRDHLQIVPIIQQLSNLILAPIAQRIPVIGGLDFSPVIAMIVLKFLESLSSMIMLFGNQLA